MSRHEDQKLIEVLWKQIIANGTLLKFLIILNFKLKKKLICILILELEKVTSTDMKPSEIKNQLGENLSNIAKEYAEDDENFFPLSNFLNNYLLYLKRILMQLKKK